MLARLAPLALAALALSSAACGAAAPAPSAGPSRDLRLRHVVLYQNGIGYFERTGVLRDQKLRLHFREREIDDVLKSLVVVEEGLAQNEKPSTISALLPQAEPREGGRDAEAETWLDLVLSPPTRRSVSIAYAVPTAAWKATYRILLPDADRKPSRGALLQAWALVDNVSDEDWSGVKLTLATGAPLSFASDLRSPRFVPRPDAQGGAAEPIATGPVAAEHAGAGDRDRDGVPDASDACPAEPGALQADPSQNGCPQHARRIVVSSSEIQILQQIQFERDGHAIRAESRPILDEIARVLKQHPEIRSLSLDGHASRDERDLWALSARRASAVRAALLAAGVTAELTVKAYGDTRPMSDEATDEGRRKNRRVELHIEQDRAPAPPPAGAARPAAVERAPSAAGPPQDVAGTVRYDITHPISIPRRSTTLVTLINEYVPGEDALLFRPDPAVPTSTTYPFRAARLENQGELGLQPGAVSIFAGGTFVGEGLLGKLGPGETAVVPYAVDNTTTVRVTSEQAEHPVRVLSLERGVMTVENAGVLTTRYEVRVGRNAPARLFVRHERHAGYEARGLPPRTETTDAAHLVPMPIRPGASSVLTIEEAEPRRRALPVLDTSGATLGRYLQGSQLPPEAEKQVREIVGLRTELGKLEEALEGLRAQLADTAQRATELRESLRAIERTPRAADLQRKLLDRLAEATARSEQLSQKLAEQSAAYTEARARLAEQLRELRVEEKPALLGERF